MKQTTLTDMPMSMPTPMPIRAIISPQNNEPERPTKTPETGVRAQTEYWAGDRIITTYWKKAGTITGTKQFKLTGTQYLVKDDDGFLRWEDAKSLERTTLKENPYPLHWYGHNGRKCYWTWRWDEETKQLISIDVPEETPTVAAQNEIKKQLQDGRLKEPPSWYREPTESGYPSQYVLELNAPYENCKFSREAEAKLEPKEPEPPKDSRVWWILANSASDINYKTNIPRLTDEELEYCIRHEARKSGLRQLEAEKRRRKRREG